MNNHVLTEKLKDLLKKKDFMSFDHFIIKKMGYKLNEGGNEDIRWKAYKTFLSRIKGEPPVSIPTMKRWFGILGYTTPSREHIFRLSFSLGLDAAETSEYLMNGIGEPSIQINDYREAIYWYSIENGLSLEESEQMIEEYENQIDYYSEMNSGVLTQELLENFQIYKDMPKEKFVAYMVENAKDFKGYSKTIVECMKKYRSMVYQSAKEDARLCLHNMLLETNYYQKKNREPDEKDAIRQYIYHDTELDPILRDNVLELTRIVYSDEESNKYVLQELFSFNYYEYLSEKEQKRVHYMTEKRMSDLFSIAIQKERSIQAKWLLNDLKQLNKGDCCPQHVQKFAMEVGLKKELKTVQEGIEWLKMYGKKQRGRCPMIQRSDIIPFVMYMVQRDYLKKISYNMEQYNKKYIKNKFLSIANAVLNTCNMAMISEQYEMDAIILQCFQDNDMYSYSDVFEELKNLRYEMGQEESYA